MAQYIAAMDEGTTSCRTILFDHQGQIVCMAQQEITQYFPQPGYVEQDAQEIYDAQMKTLDECIQKSGIRASDIAAIGITNQRETTIVWDKMTGEPLYHAIVWQCRRSASICEALSQADLEEEIAQITGLKLDAYFSGTKLRWILDAVPGAQQRAEKGELLFGTVDTWLLWKMTDGKVHVTDRTNASRTMLYDLETGNWDQRMLSILNIPACMLPEVRSSSEIYAYLPIGENAVPVAGIAGDQQAALFGQACFEAGEMKSTYGTGCFLLTNTGRTRLFSQNGLLTTAAASCKGEPMEYALEGSIFVGGAVIQWIRDQLGLIGNAAESEACACLVEDTGGVYLVPAFAGLGAPYWNMNARGTIVGLTRGTSRNHLIRAALESIAYQTMDVVQAMQQDLGKKITALKVDGGASANGFLMQFQADLLNCDVVRPHMQEATALGAAFLAGLAVGFWKDRNELRSLLGDPAVYSPQMDEAQRNVCRNGWAGAIRQTQTG